MSARDSAHRVVAIDGPAASGKSSVARALAKQIGFDYVNSGAMYRAMTWHILNRAVPPGDAAAIIELVEKTRIDCTLDRDGSHILIDGTDPSAHLCDEQVNEPGLEVPHPRLHERLFALEPLLELDPGLILPARGPLAEIVAGLQST